MEKKIPTVGNLNELDKLEEYLEWHGYFYERQDRKATVWAPGFELHQIIVYNPLTLEREWDAVCHRGSYGFTEGLLEIAGTIIQPEDGDSVVGWQTAEDIIKRLESQAGGGSAAR